MDMENAWKYNWVQLTNTTFCHNVQKQNYTEKQWQNKCISQLKEDPSPSTSNLINLFFFFH